MEFRILGPLQVLDEGRLLPLGGAKQRSTLAMLLLGRNQVVSRDRLIDGLWGASPPPSASPSLETYVSRLRRVFPGDGNDARLVTQPPGYRMRVEAGELDLERFETLLDQARAARAAGDFESARNAFREALSLFRGAPLEDPVHAPFAQPEIGRLEEVRLGALEQRLEADLAVGRHAEVVGELESLAARHPFREVLWGQLMLALYRSGRQGEALLAFDRARRTLAEEFGVDPGQLLKQLHFQILQQDPSLEPSAAAAAPAAVMTSTRGAPARRIAGSGAPSAPASAQSPFVAEPSTPSTRGEDRIVHRRSLPKRPAVVVAVALAVAVTLGVVFILRIVGAEGDATTASGPGTVLIDLASGKVITSIPLSRLAVSAYPVFADGHFWVHNFFPNSFVEIDPKTGRILRQVNPPPWPVDVSAESETLTPFAVQGNTLWAGSGHDLVKVDIDRGRVVERFRLDDYVGGGSGLAEGVAVGGGSVWVSRDVGRGQIVRLDPATGAVQHRFDDMNPYLHLAYGDGSLWAADESFARAADERGIARIDAETNTVTRATGIQGNIWVAAGGGFGWTSDPRKGVVYKVDETGHLVETYTTGLGAGFMAHTNGVLWVANRDEGTITGIDAVTGKRITYRFRHPVETIAAGDGVLLVYVARGQTVEDFIASIADAGQLGQGEEPALNTNPGAIQIDYATCATLLNYPDKPGLQGRQLQPEVAATMPAVSPDGRTYTFTVRRGYKFSPPSNQQVTAETFRYSIERALSPRLAQNPLGLTPPGPQYIDDIEGEQAFRSGKAEHISGLQASGDRLSITLTKPSPDFLARLALPFFCPVPIGTPFVPGAPHQGQDGHIGGYIPSAGPYYVADVNNDEYVILKRNPNYRGPRPQAFDAIAILEGVGASIALDWTEQRGWDGITSLSDPLLNVGGAVDRRWGAASAAAARDDQRYFLTPLPRTRFIVFNASRGLFADPQVRRAAALALDRSALAAVWRHAPTDQILSSALPGYRERDLYPLQALQAKARALMDGRTGRAVMAVPPGCEPCSEAAHVVQTDLATIGIEVEIREVDLIGNPSKPVARFDLVDAETGIPYPDSASFLRQLLTDTPSDWIPSTVRAKIERIAGLSGDSRQTSAAALADRLAADEVPVAAYATPQASQFIGPHIGCREFTPFGYGLDLAALCINESSL